MRRVLRGIANWVTRIEWIEALALALSNLIGRAIEPRRKPDESCPFDVDAVYLWVDDTDPVWRRKKALHQHGSVDADSPSRFREFGELQVSIKMLAKNAPWIRTVFIVTDDQKPGLDSPEQLPFEIVIVDHSSILPEDSLPTFSSRALTANMHRIPDLAEHFIYMNDDTFINAPSSWRQFFETQSGNQVAAKLRNTNSGMPPLADLSGQEIVYRSRYRTNEVAASNGWQVQAGPPEHGAHAMLKSVLSSLWREIPAEMQKATNEKFRTSDSVLPEWLHDSYALRNSLAVDASSTKGYKYIAVNKVDAAGALIDLLLNRGRILVLCLNDEAGLGPREALSSERLERRMSRVLSKL